MKLTAAGMIAILGFTAFCGVSNASWCSKGTVSVALAQAAQDLDTAKANTKQCEAAVEAVQYENLKAAEVAAQANVNLKAAAYDKADAAVFQYENEQYLANAAYEKALYQQTNVNWEITYLNASRSENTASGVGCVKLTAAIEELSAFEHVKMESSIPGLYGIRTCRTWAACTALVKEFTDATAEAKEALLKADAALVSATADRATAAAALEVANDALTAAQNNLANITILQYEAARDLEKAETAQAAAQKAYDKVDKACVVELTDDGRVELVSGFESATIYYTLDGCIPTVDSEIYTEPIELSDFWKIHAVALTDNGDRSEVLDGFDWTRISFDPALGTMENGLFLQMRHEGVAESRCLMAG